MANLADIPPQFLFPNKAIPFVAWVRTMPFGRETKREILSIWAQEFKHSFQKQEWETALSVPGQSNDTT